MFNQLVYNLPSLLANKPLWEAKLIEFLEHHSSMVSTVNALMQTEFGSFRMAHEILIRFYWLCKVIIWSDLLLSIEHIMFWAETEWSQISLLQMRIHYSIMTNICISFSTACCCYEVYHDILCENVSVNKSIK